MAHHQHIGLRAVKQSERYAGVRRVMDRALPFNQIPMASVILRAQPLGRPGDKVSHNCIHRHTVTRDKNAGLTRCSKSTIGAPRPHFLFDSECGEHLADRSVRTDS